MGTYQRRNSRLDAAYFLELATTERLVGWIVGLPIHCDGKESQKSTECRQFATWLSEQTRRPVTLFDERFTTSEARRLLSDSPVSGRKKRQRLDGVAAQLILTHYLESRQHDSPQNMGIGDPPAPL